MNQYCFCNTELRTAIITKIKGLSIQTQQNTFVLFTLFKLTPDERKTLTKISTCKTSHNHSPNKRTLRTQRNKKTSKQQFTAKSCLHNWWRTRALGFHHETTEESKKQQDWFCIKLYIIFVPTSFIFFLYGSRNVISLFFRGNYYKFQLRNSKFKTLFPM